MRLFHRDLFYAELELQSMVKLHFQEKYTKREIIVINKQFDSFVISVGLNFITLFMFLEDNRYDVHQSVPLSALHLPYYIAYTY
jgi:hypothetical protein